MYWRSKSWRRLVYIPLVITLLFGFTSCVNTRKATYFNDIKDTTMAATIIPESVIQKNDLLSISVSSLNPEASQIFNTPNTSTATGATATGTITQSSGYLVDKEGYIQFPILGNIRAEGLSKSTLKQNLTKSLVDKKLLVDPIVNIRFLNYRVTVLGEVKNPSVVSVPSEKISLLEAIGLAGDLTIYAKRNNVLLIREEGEQKIVKRLDLNSSELFTSPYYYLKSNDIVYVEPNKARVASASRSQQWLPILLSGLSFAIIVVDRVIR